MPNPDGQSLNPAEGWRSPAFAATLRREPRAAGPSIGAAIGYVGAVVVASVVLVLRQAGVSPLDTIWAEDGVLFLADAINRPFRDVVLTPYAGYVNFMPRLLAEVASHLPLELAAITLSGGSALVVALSAAFVYRASSQLLQRRGVRLTLASAIVLLPVVAREALNNAANLHWFLIFAAFWALLWVPSSWPHRVMSVAVVSVAALSDPLTVLLFPAAALRVVAVRGWADHLVTIAWMMALALQVAIVLGAPVGQPVAGASAVDIGAAYGARVVSVNFLGLILAERLWPTLGGLLPVLGLAVLAAIAVYAATRPAFATRPIVLLAIAVSLLMFASVHYIRWTDYLAADATWTVRLGGSRYAIVPALTLLSAAALLLDRRDPRASPERWTQLLAGVLVWYVVVAAMSLSIPNGREAGPSWREAVDAARGSCVDPAVTTVDIPIAPPGWSMSVVCDTLR